MDADADTDAGNWKYIFFSKKKLGLGNELWRSNTHPRRGFSSSWIWGLRTGCAGLTFMPRLGGICFDELGASLFLFFFSRVGNGLRRLNIGAVTGTSEGESKVDPLVGISRGKKKIN